MVALLSGTTIVFPRKLERYTSSYGRSSDFFTGDLYRGLSFIDSFQRKLAVFFTTTSRKLRQQRALTVTNEYSQNADFPKIYGKKEKKPFPVPVVELRRAARERLKNKNKNEKPKGRPPPPKQGLVVQSLIPLAYEVYNARITLINNIKRLLKAVPVHACGWCDEIHVGPEGHPFRTCKGKYTSVRKGVHEWTNAVVEDIIVPIETYHLDDRLGKRIRHDQRFSIPRIPAVVELCIQAGVDLPEFPTKRRRKPVIWIGRKEFVDADESELPDPVQETTLLSEETLAAWEEMTKGCNRLRKMYPVRVCGYCPEVHVGPSGHKVQICGAHKHQQRNGQHGWQAAVLNDLIPPRFVWHLPDPTYPQLKRELKSFYGKAPAVVELCIQGGAQVPEEYKTTMRLDVGIPTNAKEAEMVV
ncbi:APO protein 2, chloroplastic [Linum grandiflorum]